MRRDASNAATHAFRRGIDFIRDFARRWLPAFLSLALVVANGPAAAQSSSSYTYDSLGRLVQEIRNNGQTNYTYDSAGNRQSVVTLTSVAQLSSGDLQFGTVTQGAVVASRTLSISNPGTVSISITGLSALPPPMSIASNSCGNVAPNGNCAITVSLNTAAIGSWSQSVGSTGDGGIQLTATANVVAPTPPGITLTGCTMNSGTTAPTPATLSCTVGNSGQTTASSIVYSSPSNTTAAGPSSCAAGSSNCGMVTVTTSAVAGTYSGTLTATPNTGSAGSQSVGLTVNPGLGTFSVASPVVTSPGGIYTVTVTVTNTGYVTITGIGQSCTGQSFYNQGTPPTSLAPNASANYSCAAAGGGASINNLAMTITGSNATNSPYVVLAGAPPTVTASIAQANVTTGGTNSLSWTLGGSATSASATCSGAASGSGTTSPIAVSTSGTGTGSCTVTAQNAAGATATPSTVTFQVLAAPTVSGVSFTNANTGGRQGSCRVSGANQAASLRSSASFDVGVSGLRLT